MTYDPYRYPYSNEPRRDDLEPYSASVAIGVVVVLAALMFGAIVGLIFAGPSGQNFATNDLRPPITQQSTTGSSANMPPAPQPRLEQ